MTATHPSQQDQSDPASTQSVDGGHWAGAIVRRWWPPTLRRELEVEKRMRMHACEEWAEDHTHLQNLCRAAGCTEHEVEGDRYGVPGIIELADLLHDKLSSLNNCGLPPEGVAPRRLAVALWLGVRNLTHTKMKTHELKTWPSFFKAVESGNKTFECRKNDRDFAPGDTLILKEYDPGRKVPIDDWKYTGRTLTRTVGFVVNGGVFGVEPGHCVMALLPPPNVEISHGGTNTINTQKSC